MVRTALRFVRHPGDAFLTLHMAMFIAAAPRLLAKGDLRDVLSRMRRTGRTMRTGYERIRLMRGICLRFGPLAKSNTCYVRALTLYRYLDAPDDVTSIHFGIERQEPEHARLHGHAWVSVDGEILEGPPAVLEGRIREIPLAGALQT
jgi:hypothetical protein